LSEVQFVCTDFNAALKVLRGAGLRLDVIYPAEEPHTALLSHGDETIRLTSRPEESRPSPVTPPFNAEFVLTRGIGQSGEGRAGMRYRDLVPSRLGGRYIASHITIAEGGPVADWVHFHSIALQLLYVRAGWVKVVYEDQGDPFIMEAGDLVLQPPRIRHRVLESSPGLEVIEIGCPALHETFADHQMSLPTAKVDPWRDFGGQRFLHHVARDMPWTSFRGGTAQETDLGNASGGLAEARTIQLPTMGAMDFSSHDGELVFGFVLQGSASLHYQRGFQIGAADAFVIPPGEAWSLGKASQDFRLLHVTTGKID
jgi:quercetin dioxygenase-like cupin family protein